MRLPIIPMIILLLLNIAVDYYIYTAIKRNTKLQWLSTIQLFSAPIFLLYVIVIIMLPLRTGSNSMLLLIMWLLFFYFSIYIPKYLFLFFDVIASLPKLWHRHRCSILSVIGTVIAIIVFFAMWWGALINRYAIDIRNVTVEIPGLPETFEGYRIAQFSDLHLGTYGNDTTYVAKIVDCINAQDVDAILFTGDIVNRKTNELFPFMKTLSRLKAKDGVFSILGNHDYGDYMDWDSDADKAVNMTSLCSSQEKMGWQLLRNETAILHKGNDSIALIGVEHIGEPPFNSYGSLEEAYPTIDDKVTKILLTHNPVHWVNDIRGNATKNIALTLSGHTHAMQIAIGRFSPAAWRYETWSGLYSDKSHKQQLYVNIGIGTVGIPMRIGATPEITIITLEKSR